MDSQSAGSRPLRIAILECDTGLPKALAKYKRYGAISSALLESGAEAACLGHSDVEISLWDVVHDAGKFPKLEDVDGVFLTGSKFDSFADIPWTNKLVEYIKEILAQDRVKLVGVCFGHQIIGRAMGAKVGRNEKQGWEVSVIDVDLTAEGKHLFGGKDVLSIYQMHKDIVFNYPPGVQALGSTNYITRVCSIISSYLANSHDPQATATSLVEPIGDTWDANIIWEIILGIVRHKPYTHPILPKLVTLLAAIKEMPNSSVLQNSEDGHSWHDLPYFGWEARENWNRSITDADSQDGWSCTPEAWTSMNAFVAQLTVAGVSDFKTYAIWGLREALEQVPQEWSPTGRFVVLDDLLPAAAVWILVAGEVMFKEWMGLEEPSDRGGKLWEGKGFSVARWNFWRERFRWIEAQTGGVTQETRDFAGMAAKKMDGVEKTQVAGARDF
ncbi:MAG: hypothetical protein Q9218_000592 [Villophora microphyllina]